MESLRDLQMLAETEFSIEDTRRDLGDIVKFFKEQEYHDEMMQLIVVQERKLSMEIAEESDIFFIDEDLSILDFPEEWHAEALGMVRFNHFVFAGRLVYPVKDVRGQVMGMCGWDKFFKPKYLDSRNHGYKAKETSFYGMEKLSEYYSSNKKIYVVEGIVCCLYLRMKGFYAIALLGSSITSYVYMILKRIERRLIFIPDNDVVGKAAEDIAKGKPAGEHFVKQAKRLFPLATVIQSKVAKDVDDTRLLDEGKYEDQFLADLNYVGENPFIVSDLISIR